MTDREKIIGILSKTEFIDKNYCINTIENRISEILADALIAAGIGDVNRVEVLDRALELASEKARFYEEAYRSEAGYGEDIFSPSKYSSDYFRQLAYQEIN